MTDWTHQKDLDGSQDVHGSSEGRAQVETDAHSTPELRPQRAADHEVRPSGWVGGWVGENVKKKRQQGRRRNGEIGERGEGGGERKTKQKGWMSVTL